MKCEHYTRLHFFLIFQRQPEPVAEQTTLLPLAGTTVASARLQPKETVQLVPVASNATAGKFPLSWPVCHSLQGTEHFNRSKS